MTVGEIYSESIEYGNTPYPIRVTYEDRSGNTTETLQGIARIVISYGENFNAGKLSYYDAKGELVRKSDDGISEAVFEHDPEKGFLISESFYDEKLAPVMCNENYSRVNFAFDSAGKLSGRFIYDASGGRITKSDDFVAYNEEEAEEVFQLGLKYYNGDGVDKDYVKAARCFEKVARLGYANAEYSLGVIRYNGLGARRITQRQKNGLRGQPRMEILTLNICWAICITIKKELGAVSTRFGLARLPKRLNNSPSRKNMRLYLKPIVWIYTVTDCADEFTDGCGSVLCSTKNIKESVIIAEILRQARTKTQEEAQATAETAEALAKHPQITVKSATSGIDGTSGKLPRVVEQLLPKINRIIIGGQEGEGGRCRIKIEWN